MRLVISEENKSRYLIQLCHFILYVLYEPQICMDFTFSSTQILSYSCRTSDSLEKCWYQFLPSLASGYPELQQHFKKRSSEEHPLQRSFRVKAFAAPLYYGHLRVSQQKPYDYPSYFTPFFFPNYLVLECFCTESLV